MTGIFLNKKGLLRNATQKPLFIIALRRAASGKGSSPPAARYPIRSGAATAASRVCSAIGPMIQSSTAATPTCAADQSMRGSRAARNRYARHATTREIRVDDEPREGQHRNRALRLRRQPQVERRERPPTQRGGQQHAPDGPAAAPAHPTGPPRHAAHPNSVKDRPLKTAYTPLLVQIGGELRPLDLREGARTAAIN